MKNMIIGMIILLSGNVMACQYGMDSSKRMDEVIQRVLPDATEVIAEGLEDTTLSFTSIFHSNDCPSNFKLSGHLKFIRNDQTCTGRIILKYRDNEFSSGKIRSVSCHTI